MQNAEKTACPKGHEYTPENTKLYNGARYCRTCVNARARAYHARRKAEGRPRAPGVKPHRKHLGDRCERCGFVPEHSCQLDVHHRDGDHGNNAKANLGTLCANCHRLEHQAKGQNTRA